MSTINGSGAAVQNRETISFTPNVGGEYGGRYQGPTAAVKAKIDVLVANGYAVRYECDASPMATLDFNTPTNGSNPDGTPTSPNADYTDNFQVIRNTVQKEILASDHPLIQDITTANFQELKKYFADGCPDNVDFIVFSGANVNSIAACIYFYELFQAGVRSVEVKQPVLRVTRVTNPNYDAPFNVANADDILSTAEMLGDSGVPSNFAIPLLDLANKFIDRAGGDPPPRSDDLQLGFGWLKDVITAETVGTTKNQYVIEYKFGLYDTVQYGAALV